MASIKLGCSASLYHLVVISSERYVAIKHSLRYETLVTTNRLITAVATAWTIPVTTTLIMALINVVLTNHDVLAEALYLAIVFLCIPGSIVAIGFCQVAVFLESRRHHPLGGIRRRISEAPRPSPAGKQEIAPSDRAPVTRISRSHSLDLSRDLANELRIHRKNCV